MHRVERSVLVAFTAGQMFERVAAVKDSPAFLPWCAGAQVRARRDGLIDATTEIRHRGVRSRFATGNDNRAPAGIRMTLVDGPFRRLTGDWRCQPLREDACNVHLNLHYDFAPGLRARASGPVFDGIAGSRSGSFTRRAEALHDPR